ncbi:MAG: hypothetical protein EON56_02660 [Alphaproteobacteria bacterium]|nr:MAG: hypothetical protein EON56_02660 [Alphaproteobacteria bacterium]
MSTNYLSQSIKGKLSREEVLARARAWYTRQLNVISKAHGSSWPEHREWVEAYLKEEIRERLYDLGWRPPT